jgi:hypothetical protein
MKDMQFMKERASRETILLGFSRKPFMSSMAFMVESSCKRSDTKGI